MHENLAFMSDELVELDNGLLTRSMTPYAKLNVNAVKTASANMKVTSKFKHHIKSSFKEEELGSSSVDGEEEEEKQSDLHQLGKIFGNSHLCTPDLKSKFRKIFLQLDEILRPLGNIVSFHTRLGQGHQLLRSCGEEQEEKVKQWKMEAAKDETFELLNSLMIHSLRRLTKLLNGEEIPHKSQQIEFLRFRCIRDRDDDSLASMISLLQEVSKNHPEERRLIQFHKRKAELYKDNF